MLCKTPGINGFVCRRRPSSEVIAQYINLLLQKKQKNALSLPWTAYFYSWDLTLLYLMFKFTLKSQVEECLDGVSEFCLKKMMHPATAVWFPQLWLTLFKWWSNLKSHTHKQFSYLKKIWIHKSKCRNQSASVQQLAVISILYELTRSTKYLVITILYQVPLWKVVARGT